MESFINKYIFLLLLHLCIGKVIGCSDISQFIHSMPYLSSPGTTCLTGKDCMSVHCTSSRDQAIPFSVGISILSCDEAPTIEINANIPSSGIISWRAIFNDQSEQPIPGFFLPASSDQSIKRQGHLKVKLEKAKHSNSVILGLTLKGCEYDSEKGLNPLSCTEKQIVNNQQITCDKDNHFNRRKCSIHRPYDCGMKETCFQINGQFENGLCLCLEGLVRDPNNVCSAIHPPPNEIETGVRTGNETSDAGPPKDSAALAVNIVVPLLILTVVGALLYAAFKHGLLHRLMIHFNGRQFDRMNITRQDEDDDDDLSLA